VLDSFLRESVVLSAGGGGFGAGLLAGGALSAEKLCRGRLQQIPYGTRREDFSQTLCFIKVREDRQFTRAALFAVRVCVQRISGGDLGKGFWAMAYRSQRFIQAANLRLDVPVSVSLTELPDDAMRVSLEDATLLAFEEVTENCILHDVDFLLLSGNVFIEADRSLRARLAIQKSFQRLHGAGIHVFVLPGDSDPAEAWRLVPDLPDNVTICYSSNPEPESLLDGDSDLPMTLVSSALWIGAADDFGIQVIARGGQSLQPFRIGVLSRARYEESQRMAALAASAADDVLLDLAVNPSSGEKVSEVQSVADTDSPHVTVWRSVEVEQGERPARLPEQSMRRLQDRSGEAGGSAGGMEHGFLVFADEVLREGQLNFLALLGESERVTMWREQGVVHCPGTTQARSRLESVSGVCSLVDVSESGEVHITPLDTSCVDWKLIELHVAGATDTSTLLQHMRTRLLEERCGAADRIWSVQWILRGVLPVLRMLRECEFDTLLALELDHLQAGSRALQLLHDVRYLPDAWPPGNPAGGLPDQYQQHVSRPGILGDAELTRVIESDREFSTAWKQRLLAVLPSLDPEQILARIREDGATWFEPRFDPGMAEDTEESDLESPDYSPGPAESAGESSEPLLQGADELEPDDESDDESERI